MAYVCNPADFAGNFIEEVEPVYVGNRERRLVKLRCLNPKCNKEFVVDLYNAKRTKRKT